MTLSEFIQRTIRNFLIIFALIMIILTFLRQMYDPNLAFDLMSIYIIMGFSLISALTGFILYSANETSENNMRIRLAIHFITLEILLVALASIMHIVTSVSAALTLALQIAIVYIIVRLLSWNKDKREASKINEKLKSLKKGSNGSPK